VDVEDHGIGIAPAMTEAIFEMFTQAKPAPGRQHDGLGIGLALSRRLVQLHGGRLQAASAGPGQGSCFTVSLAARSAAQRAEALLAPADLGGGLDGLRHPGAGDEGALRILVVDDNHDAAAALSELLRLGGHDAAMAPDGHAAIRACTERQLDALVIDIGMPGLDGYQTAEAIRALPRAPRPLLIALSGWGQPADRERSLRAGFDLHLVKPVDVDELRRALARAGKR
jgi:two-component system CheB/CheR fusion protein